MSERKIDVNEEPKIEDLECVPGVVQIVTESDETNEFFQNGLIPLDRAERYRHYKGAIYVKEDEAHPAPELYKTTGVFFARHHETLELLTFVRDGNKVYSPDHHIYMIYRKENTHDLWAREKEDFESPLGHTNVSIPSQSPQTDEFRIKRFMFLKSGEQLLHGIMEPLDRNPFAKVELEYVAGELANVHAGEIIINLLNAYKELCEYDGEVRNRAKHL